MRISIAPDRLADPDVAEAAEALRRCVECGAANAVCPTYLLLNDENDSPRGRNRIIRRMLETDSPPTTEMVRHLDRCLSCNACTATCLARVDFMHMIDTARRHVERTYRRPLPDRLMRWLIATVLPHPARFRAALRLAALAAPVAGLLPGRLAGMIRLAAVARAGRVPTAREPSLAPAAGGTRVALLEGCVQDALAPQINAATVRVLARLGCEVVRVPGAGCCGALVYHMGRDTDAVDMARRNVAAWAPLVGDGGISAIVINASGCGTMVKDYGHLFRNDSDIVEDAAAVSRRAVDVSEFLSGFSFETARTARPLRVAYHPPCSLQHAQKVREAPRQLLNACGYTVVNFPESHLCCGSAGAYSMLQPEISGRLGARKAAAIESCMPDVIATGNIGCMTQIAAGTQLPVVHVVELLDWATGGPQPPALGR